MSSRRQRTFWGDDVGSSLTSVAIGGFKSLAEPRAVELRELTVLAGANSSGKSSVMQPLLLMKQTVDAPFDPGPLRLDGENVRFSSADQFLCKRPGGGQATGFSVAMALGGDETLDLQFGLGGPEGLTPVEMRHQASGAVVTLRPGMAPAEVRAALSEGVRAWDALVGRAGEWAVERDRCFLGLELHHPNDGPSGLGLPFFAPAERFKEQLQGLIHVPGLRGNPLRAYGTTAHGPGFPGTFEKYVASVVNHWQKGSDRRLGELGQNLRTLGLTWKISARQVDAAQVELRVGRLPRPTRGGAADLVSIADVGFGVSQVLPVLVALLVAEPGRLVYIEQPEIHLHPRAQVALAEVLAQAAQRGVRVVVETHSDLLLVGIQSLVAEGKLEAEKIKLHWFERGPDGATKITSHDMDETGAFGDWPVDFGEVAMAAEGAYLDAAEARLAEGAGA